MMSSADTSQPLTQAKMDPKNLYREETFSDLKVGSIRRLTPVNLDGSKDKGRRILFIGQTQLMTPQGPIPVQAPIKAKNLQEAVERFPAAVNQAVEQLVAEVEELRRKEASRIVVPGSPAGGKIHLG
jgi:hypothetical protein